MGHHISCSHRKNLAQCGEDTDRESTTTMDESRLSSSEDATDEALVLGGIFWASLNIPTMWPPPVISWFINLINYSYIYKVYS